jgi:serine protease Do
MAKSHFLLGFMFLLLARSFAALTLICAVCLSAQAQDTATPAPPAVQAPLPEPSVSARELFGRTKDRIVQVRVLLASASEQSSLGSGFLVRDDGAQGAWVLTNYHVISALAIDPERYRVELRGTNERTVKAQLMALDVIHDLAVLRTEPAKDNVKPWNVFALRDTPLVQGTKVFSLGNPLELGFLISEGIYNGPVESRIYEQMLFSGALNSGMSGGPAIDEAGRVVGVNVATRRDGEQLSFLVPVRYARTLLERAASDAPRKEWRSEIARQLLEHQAFVASKLLGEPAKSDAAATAGTTAGAGFSSQVLAGRTVPTLDGSLTKCWARGRDGEKLRYQRDSVDCSLRSDLFVRNSLYTGTMNLSHELLRNDKLATPQFLSLGARGTRGGWSGSLTELTRNECHDDYVQGAKQVYRVAICARAYRKFEGVYDYTVSATQVDNARERLNSSLQLRGFSFENAQKLGQLFLERLQ